MKNRGRALVALAFTLTGISGLSFRALGQAPHETSSSPAVSVDDAPKLRVAVVDAGKVLTGFAKGASIQKQRDALMMEMRTAQQSGDNQKTAQLQQELGQLGRQMQAFQPVIMDAVHEVAKEKHIDLVFVNQAVERAAIYRAPDLQTPDISQLVIERINALVATRPALDSQPASQPASRPMRVPPIQRPRVHVQPPPTK